MNEHIERIQQERPARTQPALRLVDTRKIERADWLEVRKSGIGGSDAAAAVGLNPHKSALELWMEKTGRDAHLPQPDPTDTREPVFWGSLLEPIVAAAYTQQTGNRVRKVNAVLRHPTVPYMLANLDREVVGAPGVQILECKTAGEFGARLWRDGVPEYVQLQVQHQLAVTGKQAADVAVLLCGQKLEVYRIQRDDDLIARLIELEGDFWRHVTEGRPPPADGSDSADKALRTLQPVAQARAGRLLCVLGCGGNRDASKRPLMARVAEQGADVVMLTSDNPRHEAPQAIVDQMVAGLHTPQAAQVELDRRAAIVQAVRMARPQDVVLVAGKGHETYQEVASVRLPFSDADEAMAALDARLKGGAA